MNTLPLELIWKPEVTGEIAGCYLAGGDATHWLQELSAATGRHELLRLFMMPADTEDRTPGGLFVIFPNPPARLVGLSFRKVGTNCYLPMEGYLTPAVNEAELQTLVPGHVNVCHPVLGWVSFEAGDELKIDALLQLPPQNPNCHWNCAVTPEELNRRLVSIRVDLPPELTSIFEEEAKEIGSDPVKLPKQWKRPQGSPQKSGGGGKGQAGSGLGGLLGGLSGLTAKPLQFLQNILEATRTKELRNLLDLLKSNPDEALRRAIPLSSTQSHRGIAPPTDRLGERSPNFDLTRLGGGGAADFWDVPLDIQLLLRTRYTELANQELRLGRYRRAAYIFAHLLGDLHAAANALHQGKHFREAAILYRDHLHNPKAAARCFEEAGLLADALELYQGLNDTLEVGRVARKMGNEELAVVAYRKAVADYTENGMPVKAAEILDQQLGAPLEALQLLDSAWPSSGQAVAALEAYLKLCQRIGIDLRGRLDRFRKEIPPALIFTPTTRLLVDLARNLPERNSSRCAADVVRVLIGKRLPFSAVKESHELTDLLAQLNPSDLQLRRDAARFCAGLQGARVVTTPSRRTKPGKPLLEFQLPGPVKWRTILGTESGYFAAGVSTGNIHALRGMWNGHMQTVKWDRDSDHEMFLLAVDPSRMYQVYLMLFGEPFIPNRFFADDRFTQQFSEVGTPSWCPRNAIAVAAHGGKVAFIVPSENGLLLDLFDSAGTFVSRRTLDQPVVYGSTHCLLRFVDRYLIGSLAHVVFCCDGENTEYREFDAHVLDLIPSRTHARPGYIVITETRAILFWLGDEREILLADDMLQPRATFLRDGRIVLMDRNGGRIYSLHGMDISGSSRFEYFGGEPCAISHTGERSELAVFTTGGKVQVLGL